MKAIRALDRPKKGSILKFPTKNPSGPLRVFHSGFDFFLCFLQPEMTFLRFGDTDRSNNRVPGGFWAQKSNLFRIPVMVRIKLFGGTGGRIWSI